MNTNLCSRQGTFRMVFVLSLVVFVAAYAFGQASVSVGSIQGTVTDPSGAVVPNAKVTISNSGTGQVLTRTTTAAGAYSSGPLTSGNYKIRVEAPTFQTVEQTATVQVGVATAANFKLALGSQNQVIEVTGEALRVNTEQPTVQGELTSEQIENLPVSGRNFLDLAQLEPGVQIQDGGNFDPTKNGFSSISFGSRAGRTARIEVDGVDISDETVGTVTQNIPASAISEFQTEQSTLDISTELTSSGAVNVGTKPGTNALHGEGFYLFRDKRAGIANFPGGQDTYFQRNQFGGQVGGALIKNTLFFSLASERVKQNMLAPLAPSAPFNALPSGYSSPFRDTSNMARLDLNGPKGMHIFYKFQYHWNSDVAAFGATYSPFLNKDNTPSQAIGFDWTTGRFNHSVRYGHLKFHNMISDATGTSGVYDPAPQIGINILSQGALQFGPNLLAPQQTYQENDQIKYDGSWLHGAHTFRFGIDYNNIRGGGFASFFGLAPIAYAVGDTTEQASAATGPFPGGAGNPLNYPVDFFFTGNGFGFGTEKPGFGLPGGLQQDHRLALYIGDSWKISPNFTLTAGLRYSRDTGRSDEDLPPITCAQIPATTLTALAAAGTSAPCSGSSLLLDQFGKGLGGQVNEPNHNFGPMLGFAWDPTGSGKTSIRGGAGIYYENAIWNNVLFDRPARLTQGLFLQYQALCPQSDLPVPGGTITSFPYNGNQVQISSLCGALIGNAAPELAALQQYYQQLTKQGGAQANGGFVGANLGSNSLIAPNYKTPLSIQMNIGVQHELHKGTVFSADFIRNVSLHYLLAYDTNHVGDARYLNVPAAQSAIAATLSQCNAATIDAAILSCPALHTTGGATIDDFASNGLTSGGLLGGVLPSSLALGAPNAYAFGGINPAVGQNVMLFPVGRASYTALQMKLSHQANHLVRGVDHANFTLSYSLSRFNTMVGGTGDQDFVNNALDFNNPGRFYGTNALDRTHQVSFGAIFQVAHKGPQLSLIGHYFSPLSVTPSLENQSTPGEIFKTDWTGDGTVGDPLPGAHLGSYGRDYNGSGVNGAITAYNSKYAGQLTPAGQALVQAGLFTTQQLQSLLAVMPTLAPAPPNQQSLGWLKTFDIRLGWPIKIGERFTITPSVAAFNAFNYANFDSGVNLLSGALAPVTPGLQYGNSGSITGTCKACTLDGQQVTDPTRVGLGSGVNTLGSPRQMEFGLRFTF